VGLSGCSASEGGTTYAPAGVSVDTSVVAPDRVAGLVADGALLLDVRTPQEFASGHLEGAVNIDATSADFADRVAELARDESWVVYCASGDRAAGAVETMAELGFSEVVNGGGLEDLAGAV
jgi:rhodanese-related sulfurtransferase